MNRILTNPGDVALRTVGSNLWRGECHKNGEETWETRVPGGREKYTIRQSGDDFHIDITGYGSLESKTYVSPIAAMIAADSLDHAHWLWLLRNTK